MTRDELKQAGRALFGDRWQTAMARFLRVDPSTVRRWASGAVQIPGPVEVALEERMLRLGIEPSDKVL